MIISNTTQNKISFNARKVAITQNVVKCKKTKINIFKLDSNDNALLENLKEKIDFQTLYTKLNEQQKTKIQQIFEYCIYTSKFKEIETFIAICGNKICGILSTNKLGTLRDINGICSIPVGQDKKVNLVGQTLFYQIFNMAKREKLEKVAIEAVKDSPSNVVDRYKKLGFKSKDEGERYVTMEIDKYKISSQIRKLKKIITFKEVNDKQSYDLNKYL